MPTPPPAPGRSLSVAAFQCTPEYGDPEGNRARLVAALADGPPGVPRHPDLVVLPELATTGYAFGSRAEAERMAEPADGATTRAFKTLSARTGATYVVGFAERAGSDVFNSAAVVGPRGLLGVYRKLHLFDRETEWFDPGDEGFRTFDVEGVSVGVMICFDWFFPESLRTLTLMGASVIAHPSNLVLSWCQRAMPVRCLENHVAVITCNREGRETRAGCDYTFTGTSVICGFSGEVLKRADDPGDQWLRTTIDAGRAAERALGAIPDLLRHRRPEHYAPLVTTETPS